MCELDKEVGERVGCLVCTLKAHSQGTVCDRRVGQCQDRTVPQVRGPETPEHHQTQKVKKAINPEANGAT